MTRRGLRGKRRGRSAERIFAAACLLAVALPLGLLAIMMLDVAITGIGRLSWDFLTGFPSRRAARAGVLPGLVGSLYLLLLTSAFALPLGVGTAVYLEEYGRKSRISRLIELNIANLAGVPSIIYGVLGLGIFVRTLGLGRSLVSGALTLALLALPIVIIASREALRTVPGTLREAALALGATRWQIVQRVVLPAALPGILTGAILAIARALGETAPLIVVGALTYVTFLPDGPGSPFTALPIQIFNWISRPQRDFAVNAAAGILVLLLTMLVLTSFAVVLRSAIQRRLHR